MAGGLRPQAYVHNPMEWVDPLGLTEEGCKNIPVQGGRYGKVRYANDGGEVHHMPANSVNGLPHSQGPAIFMSKADHKLTASHGHQGLAGAKYRARQKELVDSGRFDDAIQMDIDDIRSKFGNKYDDAILQMIDSLK